VCQLRPSRFPVVGVLTPADRAYKIAAIKCRIGALVLPQRFRHHLLDERRNGLRIYGVGEDDIVHVLNAAAPMFEPETDDRAPNPVGTRGVDQIGARIEKYTVSIIPRSFHSLDPNWADRRMSALS